jgi:hypothetical protein
MVLLSLIRSNGQYANAFFPTTKRPHDNSPVSRDGISSLARRKNHIFQFVKGNARNCLVPEKGDLNVVIGGARGPVKRAR